MSTDDSGISFNRIFILGGKECSQDDFKTAFSKYGTVKDVWMVDDRKTGEFKGVTYITMSKASEAALAIEELNGQVIGNSPKALKVLMANDKREGNVRDPKEGEKMMRLFIMIPKKWSQDDVKKNFQDYGEIDYVRLIKDRKSGESRGLAYVKYYRAYHAALALEECDQSYKAVFAAPRTDQNKPADKWDDYDNYNSGSSLGRSGGGGGGGGFNDFGGLGGSNRGLLGMSPITPSMPPSAAPSPLQELLRGYPTDGGTSLEVMAAPGVTRDQLYALLDMTPGLEYCELDRESGIAYVQYKAAQCAAYAKEKLAYIEFPPGFRIAVRYPQGGYGGSFGQQGSATQGLSDVASNLSNSLQGLDRSGPGAENLETLVESIKKATTILQQAGLTGGSGPSLASNAAANFNEERVRFCNVPLPLTKPFAHRDSSVGERLFIVSQPEAFSGKYLHDVLCRFGGLIDAFFMPGKNFGYAKYSSQESAENAMKVLHGQQVCGMRLKVMKADPPKHDDKDKDGERKRARLS